jgi:hypothetical protein
MEKRCDPSGAVEVISAKSSSVMPGDFAERMPTASTGKMACGTRLIYIASRAIQPPFPFQGMFSGESLQPRMSVAPIKPLHAECVRLTALSPRDLRRSESKAILRAPPSHPDALANGLVGGSTSSTAAITDCLDMTTRICPLVH